MTTKCKSFILALAALLPFGCAWAQTDYPNRLIKIVSPTAVGSGGDTLARRLTEPLAKLLGQPVIVENKPGAQSKIGAIAVARASSDGYTLLLGGNSFVANVHMMKDVGYDPVKDFTPISLLNRNPLLLVVNAETPVRTVQEFIKYAKARPGKLNYGVGNSGSLVAAQLLRTQSGIQAVSVNYPGMAQAATDLLAGRVDFVMLDPIIAKPFVEGGKLRALGVTSKQRLESFPDIAPLAESGLPGYEWVGWVGLFGPRGLSAAAVEKINKAVVQAVAEPDVVKFMTDGGMIPATSTSEQLKAFVLEQVDLWGHWTKEAGLQPQ